MFVTLSFLFFIFTTNLVYVLFRSKSLHFVQFVFDYKKKNNKFFLVHLFFSFISFRGKSLASIRERVERQRSVTSSANNGSESNSLEGLNLERGDPTQKVRCVEHLDTQVVSSLHKDVAALSMEVSTFFMTAFSEAHILIIFPLIFFLFVNSIHFDVVQFTFLFCKSSFFFFGFYFYFEYFSHLKQVRNAIQALQEMTYSTLASQADLGGRFPPARSIPNLPNDSCSIAPRTDSYSLARSSSQPADMWSRELILTGFNSNNNGGGNSIGAVGNHKIIDSTENVLQPKSVSSVTTQTENKLDLPAIEKFIVSNPRLVLNLLGIIEPTYQIECELQPQTLNPIPEADVSSPEMTSSPENNNKNFMDSNVSQPIVWESPQNSNNKNTENCRSTDALLSSDDYLLRTDDNPIHIDQTKEIIKNDNITYSVIHEQNNRKQCHNNRTICPRSNSLNSITSSATTIKQNLNDTIHQTNHPLQSTSSNSSISGLTRKHSHKDNNNSHGMRRSLSREQRIASSDEYLHCGREYDDDDTTFDELSEKCALLHNEMRTEPCNSRSTLLGIQKRHNLASKSPHNYRFSAGDADKLEKTIKHIPSTRSLKES